MKRLLRLSKWLPPGKNRSWLAFKMLQLLCGLFSLFPRRMVFAYIVLANFTRLPGRVVMAKAFEPLVVAKLYRAPGFKFSSSFTRIFPHAEAISLHHIGAFAETCDAILARALHLVSLPMATVLTRSLFELGDFDHARKVMNSVYSPSQLSMSPPEAHLKGQLDLISGDLAGAAANLALAARAMPHLMHPHQNLAARYSTNYAPHELDFFSAGRGRIYDAANYVGQRVTHVGQGHLGPTIYATALQAQKELAGTTPAPSPKLAARLRSAKVRYEDVRILPEEWFTQVGHEGMLDMLFRMRKLGWWKGTAIMLARHTMIANHSFLRLYADEGRLFTIGGNIDAKLAAELVSLQRWKGMSFNAFELPDGSVVPWQDAGALMMRQWEQEGRGYPLREAFDRLHAEDSLLDRSIAAMKARWGMKPDDWYVCLHMRDAAHYGEMAGTGQTHRNASVRNYIAAIKHITDQGGWVIKLGGPKSPKLPRMKHVFDYARSSFRSELTDLHLIRHARFFVGTTSGLTNVAVSFGVPCALVNCVTTDAQLWSNRVRFALKWIRMRDGTLIDQHAVTSTPWRWRVFSAELLGRANAFLQESTSDEILETVKEVEALANGTPEAYVSTIASAGELVALWRLNLAFPHFYGDALPGLYTVAKHASFLKKMP
jgi:putative glycosyltransferase (TIGR04372 family)